MVVLIIVLIVVGVLLLAGAGLLLVRGRPEAPPAEEAPPPTVDELAEARAEEPVEEPAEEPVEEAQPPPVEEAVEEVVEEVVEAPPRATFRGRLGKARGAIAGYFGSILSRSTITDETWEELEEALILADVGVPTTMAVLDGLREDVANRGVESPGELLALLKEQLKAELGHADIGLATNGPPSIWLFVGVNGVGKTTTIGKLARRETDAGETVVLAAGDTFRAAAAEQLGQWAGRADAELVRGAEGADPSSVVFDAVEHAAARGASLVMADTAGRLHTKSNLMEELRKVRRVAEKGEGTVTEVLLVLDATTGQNGLVQARQFTEAVDVTGVVLTKLDGSAKGGIVLAVQKELGIPVKLVGLGEGVQDLIEFDSDQFVEALFDE